MKFRYEVPDISRKKDAIEYINEFYKYNSEIHGSGGLERYLNNYEEWLLKLEQDYVREVTEDTVPARTYFFVRVDDNKIIGMTNIRTKLNQKFIDFAGNIGYSIRPTERGKGLNKINLYLALKVCKDFEIEEALMDADKANTASWRTMEALGAKLDAEVKSEMENCDYVRFYSIDVNKAIETHKGEYESLILEKFVEDKRNKEEVKHEEFR